MADKGRTQVRFPGLAAEAFVSETDQVALNNLQRVPLLPLVMRKFNEHAVDHVLYAFNSSESVRCSPRQFPTLYGFLREGCEILDLPEPELYVHYSPRYNAYTAGLQRTFVVLESSLVDAFTDDELRYVIGHELGHIKCSHVLYQMVGRMLLQLIELVGRSTMGLGQVASLALLSAFLEWMRQAEISCDRAGLLVCQNPQAAYSAIMKLGCGSTRFDGEMNVDAFLEQARNHSESTGADGMGRALLFLLYSWYLDHPQVVYRAKALDEWHRSGVYGRILRGDYLRRPDAGKWTRCPNCSQPVSAGVPYCAGCGTGPGGTRGTEEVCTQCGVPIPAGILFCMACGARARPSPDQEEPV